MSTVASSNNGAPAPGIESGSVALEGQALTDAIIFQVEYYLSRDNLSRDGYLQSQMDEEQFVKIDVLAQFKKLKTLSSDVEVIATALRGSRLVELDASGQRVKPRPRPQRNTIILREIPSSAPIESVMALFNGKGAPKVVEVRAEVGDNWFVVLENEEMALNALNWLRGQTYMDEPVRARMKTESTMLRSYFTGGGGGPRQPVVPFIPGGQQVPYYGAPMYNNNNNWAEFTPSGQQQQQMQMQQQMGQQQQHHQQGQHNGRYQGNKYEGRRGDRGDRGGYRRKSSPTRGGVMVSNGSGGGKGKKKGGNNGNSQQQQRPVPEPELTMAQFPPLHNDGSAKGAAANTAASSSVAEKDSATAVAADDSTGAQNASGVAGTAGSRPGGYGSRKIVRHSPEYIARIAQQSGAGPERPAALAKRLEGLTSGPLLPVDAKPLEGLVGITSQPLAVNSKPAPATAPSKQVWGPNAKEAIAAAPKGKPRPSPNASPVKKPASPAGKASNNNNGGAAAAASNAGPSSAAPAAATSAAQPKKEEKRPAAPAPEAAPTKAPATSASAAPGPKSWAQIAKKTAQPKKR